MHVLMAKTFLFGVARWSLTWVVVGVGKRLLSHVFQQLVIDEPYKMQELHGKDERYYSYCISVMR
jgi:hypothetical protein